MAQAMQQYFKDLPASGLTERQPVIVPAASSAPALASICVDSPFLKYESQYSAADLEIQNAALRCEVLRVKKDLLSRGEQLERQNSAVAQLEQALRAEAESRQQSEERSRIQLSQQMEALAVCQENLRVSEEKFEQTSARERDTAALCDSLTAKQQAAAADFHAKCDEFYSTIREKDIEHDAMKRQLSEVLSEKAIIEESFRLFRSSVLTDLGSEGEEGGSADSSLMVKMRLIQEANAQLSAEVKSLSRRSADSEVALAAAKEEMSLIDRVKQRLSATVDNQAEQIDKLEKELLRVKQSLLREEEAREELKEARRSLELEGIQTKFALERQELAVADLREEKQALEAALAEQRQETSRWVDRVRGTEQERSREQEKVRQECAAEFERQRQEERRQAEFREEESAQTRATLQAVQASLAAARQENARLLAAVSVQEAQASHLAEVEACVAEMQADLESKEDEIATLCTAFERRGEVLKEQEKRISLQASEISFLRPERDAKAKMAKDLQEQVDALRREKAELLRVSSQNDTRGSVIDELKMTVMQYQQQLADIEDDKERLRHVLGELDALKTEHRGLKDDYEEAEATMEELSRAAADEIQKREKQIQSLKLLLEEKDAEVAQLQEQAAALTKAKAKLEKHIKQAEKEAAAASSSMFGFRSEK